MHARPTIREKSGIRAEIGGAGAVLLMPVGGLD